jgi:hypothetical protein
VIGINTLRLNEKDTAGVGFALSASELIAVLREYYPDAVSDEASREQPRD